MRGIGIALFLSLAAVAPANEVPTPPPSRAAAVWTAQASGTTNTLNGLAFVNSLEGFAVGAGGTIQRTLDGGATTWTAQTSGTTLALNGLGLSGADVGSAAGDTGVVVRTLNGSAGGGSTWGPATTTGDFLAIASSGATNAWTAGALGVLRNTTAGGSPWLIGNSGLTADSIRGLSFVSALEGYAVGDNGKVQRTLDGVTWASPSGGTVGVPIQMNGVSMVPGTMNPTTTGWAVGNTGTVRKTTNAGAAWIAPPPVGTTQNLNAVFAGNATNAWAVGNMGSIVATNTGNTWAAQISGVGANLFGVGFVNAGTWNGIAVGSGGTVVRTTNAGSTWTPGTSLGVNLRAVSVFSTTLAIAVGDGGAIFKSIDNGVSWLPKGAGTTGENLTSVTMATAMIGWAAGANSTILVTTNGGDNWSQQVGGVPNTVNLKDVKYSDATTALAVGTTGVILKSADAGGQWSRKLQSSGANWTTSDLNALAFSVPSRAWAVGAAGSMLLTDDTGQTWTSLTAVTPDPLFAVTALSDTLYVAVGGATGHGTVVVISQTLGVWSAAASTVGTDPLRAVSFPQYSRRGYVVDDAGHAWVSTDAGTSWIMESTGASAALRGVAFPCQTLGWVAGNGGAIYRRDGTPPRLSFPPHIGTPHTYQPPLIDGFINPELSESRRPDTGWDRSAQVTYANGTTQPPVTFQGLRHSGGGYVFLSFEARVDDAFDNDDTVVILFRGDSTIPRAEHAANDRKIVINPVTNPSGGTSGGILAPGYTAPSYTNNENCDPRALVSYAWNTGTNQWETIAASTELKCKVRSWIPSAGSYSWSIELQVPTTNAVYSQWINLSTTGDFLFSYYVLQKKTGGVLEASWPRDLVVSGPVDVFTAPMPACDWGTAKLGTAADATGVRIKVPYYTNVGANTGGGTGTLLHEINGTGTNTFVAYVQNDSDSAANDVTATFRIASWGVNGNATDGAWTLVPVTSGTNPPAAGIIPAISGVTPGENHFQFDWTLSGAERTAYAPPHEHQCVQVSLDSISSVNFVERSVWVNMDYVPASAFSRPATVSAKGFGSHGAKDGVQRFFLHVTSSRFDYNPATTPIDTVPKPDPKKDGQTERKDDHPYYSGENLKRVRLNQVFPNLKTEKTPVAHYIMETHGYRQTTNKVNIHGTLYPILEQVNGFGYVARHGSAVEDWTSGLSGAVVKKLTDYVYQVDVPVNGSVPMDTGLETREGGAAGLGGGLFGLILLIFLFLLIIFWFLKKKP